MTAIQNLHDWHLCSIDIDDDSLSIGFLEPESKERRFLRAEGVSRFVCDDLRQGNIVLSIDIGLENATDDALRRLLHLDSSEKNPSMDLLRNQIQDGKLQFVSIMPSYGASIALVAKSISMN